MKFYSIFSSSSAVQKAVKDAKDIYENIAFHQNLPNFKSISKTENIQTLIILEDMLGHVNSIGIVYFHVNYLHKFVSGVSYFVSGRDETSRLINFVNKSRHDNISICMFYHEFPFNLSRTTFERYFFDQSSHFVVFDFIVNSFQLRMFASRFLGKSCCELFFDAFQISKKLCLIDKLIFIKTQHC